MAGQFDDVFGVKTEAAAPVAGGFDDIFAAGPKQNKGTAGDLVTSVKRGVLGLPGVVTGLADLAPAIGFGLRPFEKATNYIGGATGFQPSKWADKMQGEYSPSYLQAQENIKPALEQSKQELDAAQGFSETLGAGLRGIRDIGQKYIENPSAIGNIVAEALPQVAAGGVISKGLMGVGKVASMGEPALAGAAGFLERKLGLETAAAVAGGAGEGLMQAGSALSDAKGEDQRKNAVAALSSGLLDAVIGAGSGKVVQAMGLDTLETAMAKGFNKSVTGELSGKAAALSKTGKIIGGGASEGILQELPQSAQETVFQNYAEGKPLWENVPRSAVEGLLAGFVMGAGVNALPATTVKPDPKTDSGQSQLLSKLTGQDVTVTGGTATYTSPDGESFNVPVASLADHFATGGTLDTLDSATVTAPKLEALKGTLSYQEIADLRNSDELLREQGVSRRDVDNLLLSQVREVPGAEPLVRSMLETGTVDAQLIDRIKSGEYEPDPMREAWDKQVKLAQVNNDPKQQQIRAAIRAGLQDYEDNYFKVPPRQKTTEEIAQEAEQEALLNRQSLEMNSGLGLPVTPDASVLAPTPATAAEQRAERLGTYRDLFSGSTQPQQDIQATIARFETSYADRLNETNSLLAQGQITEAQARAEKEQAYRELFKNVDLTPQEIASNIQSLESNLRSPITEQQSVMPPVPTTPGQERAEQYADYRELFGGETAAPVGTPPAGSPPPSLSDTSPAGAAPLQAEQPLWRQAGLDTKTPIALDQVQAKKQTDGSYKLVYRGTENEIFTGQTFKSAPEARAVFKREQTLAQQTANAPDTLFAGNSQTPNNETQTPLSRTGEAQTEPLRTALKSFIGERAVDNLIRKGKVEIVSDVSQVPNTAKLDARQRKSVLGAYNSGQGKVFLVAGNLDPARVPEIMRHEVVHALLREDSRFMLRREGILKSFDALAKNNASVQAALAKVPAGTAESIRLEEGLAYWVQQESNHKHSLFKRIISAVKSGLARLGIPVGKYSTTDLSRMFTGGMEAWVNQGQTQQGEGTDNLFAAREAAKAFFSKLMQVGATKFEGMKAQSVEPFLLKQGVKKSEIEATGLREWLASKKPTDKVTKGELADFVKANTVEFEDVILGGDNTRGQAWYISYVGGPTLGTPYATELEAAEALDEDFPGRQDLTVRPGEGERAERPATTSFDQYTEPGAKEGSYREMFVTAPSKAGKTNEQKIKEFQAFSRAAMEKYGDDVATWPESIVRENERLYEDLNRNYSDTIIGKAEGWQDGHSQYSDIKNPIVRIRFNEVAGPNGERILRIEEMQGPSSDNQTKMPKHLKENIYQTGVKRILAYAKENGFDGVALATKPGRTAGETQADRYSLEKSISEVHYSGTNLKAYDLDGNTVISQSGIQEKDLPGIIGKEATKKLLDQPKQGTLRSLVGEELKVGGEGLKQLYDNDLPNIFKAWGGEKMGEVTLKGDAKYAPWKLRSPEGTLEYEYPSEAGAIQGAEENGGGLTVSYEPGSSMPFIPITAKTADSFPMFALDKPNTLFAMADASMQQSNKSLTQKIKDFAEDKTLDNAPRWLSIAPLHTLVQTLGKKIPQIKQLSRHLEESEYISNDLINQAYEYIKRADTFTPAIKEALNQAAFKATSYQMSPAKPMLEQEWVPQDKKTKEDKLKGAQMKWKAAGMDTATGETFISAYNKASAAYKAINNEEAERLYGETVTFMRDIRKREYNNLLAYIEKATTGNKEAKESVRAFIGTALPKEQIDAAFKGSEADYKAVLDYVKANSEDKALLKAVSAAKDNLSLKLQLLLRATASFKNVKGDYWPLTRIGDYKLEFTDIDGVKVVKHYDTAGARRTDEEMFAKNGVKEFFRSKKDRRPRGEVAIPMELMEQLSASVYNQKLAEVDPNDSDAVTEARAEAQEVVEDMNQIWLRWQPETSSLKSSIQRKTVRGADEDMLRASLEYARKHASNIAWSEQGRQIEGTLKNLADTISEERKQGVDVTSKGMVLTEMRNRLQSIRDAKTGPIASTIGKLGTAWYMTSPSIALVQMTQLPILTFPKLAVKFKSISKAMAAMKNGTQAAFSKDFSKKEIFGDDVVNTLHEQMRETVNEENRVSPDAKLKARTEGKMLGERLYDDDYIEAQFNKLKPKQQKLFVLREALARNLLDISAAHEAYALTQGKNPNGIVNKAFNLAMQPMKISEMASRKAAILATMELAQGQGKSFKRIMNNVAEVVNDTLYSYSKANKPAVLQGGTARVLAMFQWYRIMTALRMGMLAKRSFAAETLEIKAAARKEFIGIMGMTTMLAGTLGLPLMKQVFAALDALADDDEPRDSELEFRKWAEENLGATWGDVFTHGLPTLAGINISKRIGLGDLYGSQSQPPPRLHGKELAAWWAANQLGPAFGIVQGGFQGYDHFSKGEYMKGLEASLPKPLKDGLRAARVMQEGDVKSLTGRRTLAESEMTADVIPLLALGLNPAEIAQASKEGMSRSRISTAISERRGRVIDVMVQALEGDGDMEKARETLVTYNKKLPRFAIRGGDIRSALIRKMKEDRGIESRRDQLISSQYGL